MPSALEFLPVPLASAGAATPVGIEIQFPDGTRLHIPPGIDAALTERVIGALRR